MLGVLLHAPTFDNIFYRSEGFNLLGGLDRNEFIPFEKAEKGLQVTVDNDENHTSFDIPALIPRYFPPVPASK